MVNKMSFLHWSESDDLIKNRALSSSSKKKPTDYDFLDASQTKQNLDSDLDELNIDTFEDENDTERQAKAQELKLQEEKNEFKQSLLGDKIVYFNARVCKLLTEYLTTFQLSGLTTIDQIYLVALADTVANVKCDVNFDHEEDLFKKKEFLENSGSAENTTMVSQIVDNCGLKFLLALKSYNYLMRTLPDTNRDKLKDVGLGTANFAWAFHSECEQELLNSILKGIHLFYDWIYYSIWWRILFVA